MNLDRFKNSPSGRRLKVGQGESAYWAFVAHPLPPTLTLDAKLVRALSEADRALGELAGLGRAMPNPHLLIGPFVRRETDLTTVYLCELTPCLIMIVVVFLLVATLT